MNIFKELKYRYKNFLISRWIENNITYKGNKIVFSDAQKDIIDDKASKKCYLCRRQFGKSFIIVLSAIVKAIRNTNENSVYAIISPSVSSSNVKSYLLHEIISENEILNKHIYRLTREEIHLKNGSMIKFYNASMNSLRSIYANYYYVDDFEFLTQEQINYLIGRISLESETECLFLSTGNNHYLDVTQYMN